MDRVEQLFEAELVRRAVHFEREGPGSYVLTVGRMKVSVCLDNVARDFARDGDAGRIERFIDTVLAIDEPVPPWSAARSCVYWSAESATVEVGDSIHLTVTEGVVRVLTLASADRSRLTMITPTMLTRWEVSEETVVTAAEQNLDRLLDGKSLEIVEAEGRRLGMVPIDSAFKASVIFAPRFKTFVGALGWPVLVVIPCRDFIYVIAETDSELLGGMGEVVQQEYRSSGYPLTTEVLRVSDDGIEAIGAFPE